MDEVIVAILERKSTEAEDGPPSTSHWLALRLENGRTLTVFDGRALSADLSMGERYTFLLSLATAYQMQRLPAFEDVAYFPHKHHPWSLSPHQELAGVIRALGWRCPEHPYLAAHPRLYERRAVLIETPIGHLITSAHLIERLTNSAPVIGDTLEWEGGRLDLWAALQMPT